MQAYDVGYLLLPQAPPLLAGLERLVNLLLFLVLRPALLAVLRLLVELQADDERDMLGLDAVDDLPGLLRPADTDVQVEFAGQIERTTDLVLGIGFKDNELLS